MLTGKRCASSAVTLNHRRWTRRSARMWNGFAAARRRVVRPPMNGVCNSWGADVQSVGTACWQVGQPVVRETFPVRYLIALASLQKDKDKDVPLESETMTTWPLPDGIPWCWTGSKLLSKCSCTLYLFIYFRTPRINRNNETTIRYDKR